MWKGKGGLEPNSTNLLHRLTDPKIIPYAKRGGRVTTTAGRHFGWEFHNSCCHTTTQRKGGPPRREKGKKVKVKVVSVKKISLSRTLLKLEVLSSFLIKFANCMGIKLKREEVGAYFSRRRERYLWSTALYGSTEIIGWPGFKKGNFRRISSLTTMEQKFIDGSLKRQFLWNGD